MTNVKKAALYVHSLEPQDRQWLLSQLDSQQREAITAPLEELFQRGLAREDAALLFAECAVAESADPDTIESATGLDADDHAFEGIEFDHVARVLRSEHPVVAAAVLGENETLFKQVVLARLPGRHRRQSMSLATHAKWSSRVRDVAVKRTREEAAENAKEQAARGVLYWLRAALS